VSRPRRSLGNQPGRLVATMLRALAAELSDPGRSARAKAYARDGAVIEIDIRPGVVSGLVLGSRRDPYEVFLSADPAPAEEIAAADPAKLATLTMLIPGRDELAVSCSCPDAGGAPGLLCKHAIAVLLVLADESGIEPELLIRWRTSAGEGAGMPVGVARLPRRGRVIGGPTARVDPLAGMLDSPVPIPALPRIPTRPMTVPAAAVLDDPAARLLNELYADAVAAMSGQR
jgi:hypothetical protein